MTDDRLPVSWIGGQAVLQFPEHADVLDAARAREHMLALMDRGAAVLIADMTNTASCDHTAADALHYAYHRACVRGTHLRVVVAARAVRQLLEANGLHRLMPFYSSMEAALAPGPPAASDLPGPPRDACQPCPSSTGPESAGETLLQQVIDALDDGIILADDSGTIALANLRLEEMFGYLRGTLAGQPVKRLIPADLDVGHAGGRAGSACKPEPGQAGTAPHLPGVRRDGRTFPVRVSLSQMAEGTSQLILAVVRDTTGSSARPFPGPANLAGAAAPARQADRTQRSLDRVVTSLYSAGLSLESAMSQPPDQARNHMADALCHLDAAIGEIRDLAFPAARGDDGQSDNRNNQSR